MSEGQPQKRKQDKKNTDLWKLKQEEKKRKKQTQGQTQADQPQKAQKKQKKQKKKEDKKEQSKMQKKDQKKEQKKQQKNQTKTEQKQQQPPKPAQQLVPTFRKLIKIDHLITEKQRQSRIYQQQLIGKYIDQCISKNDVLLYVGNRIKTFPCQQVYCQGINNNSQAELVCRYSDLSYFLEGSVTKIFIDADYIFANGSILAKEGALNIALMGRYYNIPVLAVGGSWCYSGWAPVNNEALEERYGLQVLKKMDWIEEKYIKSLILEVGILNPKQLPIYPPIIYKNLRMDETQW